MCNKVYHFNKNLTPWFLAIPEILKEYKSDQFFVKTFVVVFASKDNSSNYNFPIPHDHFGSLGKLKKKGEYFGGDTLYVRMLNYFFLRVI